MGIFDLTSEVRGEKLAQNSKTTLEMKNDLEQCDDLDIYLRENRDNFCPLDVKEFLECYLSDKELKKSTVIRQSGLNQIYAYQIFSGVRRAERDKLLCIAVAAEMTMEEANQLLTCGGKPSLYPRVVRDSIIGYALNHHYTVEQTDDLLYDHDCKTLLDG